MNIFKYTIDLLFTMFNKPPKVLDIDETIDLIIDKKLSVSRYGDGEFDLALQTNDIGFQKMNSELGERLQCVLNSDSPNLLVCVPKVFTHKDLKRMHYYARRCWVRLLYKKRRRIYSVLDFSKVYGNAFITRNYMDLEDKSGVSEYFKKIRRIWEQRDVVIIEGEYTRFGVGNDLLGNAKSIKRILCPAKDAFEKYNEILATAKKIDKDSLILIALGPTASVLSYDLSECSYQAIDIGHLDIEYEWYLAGVQEKIGICNKWTNETNSVVDSTTDSLKDEEYTKSIISVID